MSPQSTTMNDTTSSTRTDEGSGNRAAEAYSAARERTSSAYRSARESVSSAGKKTSEQIGSNPVAAVIGGFAVGALAAAVLPRTERETRMLGEVGHKLTDTAREAARTAAQASRQQIDQITGNAVTQVGSAVVDAVAGNNQ